MNKLLIRRCVSCFILIMFAIHSYAQPKSLIKFDKVRYNFGIVSESNTKNIVIDFLVTNTGNSPVVILKATPSCSCMTVESSKVPINIGKTSTIKVCVNTKGQQGEFSKTIIIKSNAENDITLLRIVGNIIK